MNLLLGSVGGDPDTAGIGTAGTALLQSRVAAPARTSANKSNEVDIASLSTAQTAALLQQQQIQKGVALKARRHRAQSSKKRRLAHHELLEQELLLQQQQQQQQQHHEVEVRREHSQESSDNDDEQDEFAAARTKNKARAKRIQLEPQIVAQTVGCQRKQRQQRQDSSSEDSELQVKRRRRRADSSSSEDSDPSRGGKQRRVRSNSSGSSSSSEDEARRRRLKRRQQLSEDTSKQNSARTQEERETIQNRSSRCNPVENEINGIGSKAIKDSLTTELLPTRKRPQQKGSSSSSSSGCDSHSDDDDDSSNISSGSSDDEVTPAMAKPLFVPKAKRLQLAQEKAEAERAVFEQKKATEINEKKRKMESRELVAQVVMTSTTIDDAAASEDEEEMATRMLNDREDKEEEERERDLWEVRELERLLTEIDRLRRKEQDEAEYHRRQQLTDEQARAEDIASGRYQQPGSNRMTNNDGPKYQQRYFHRGAYYMDEDEFDEDDVRRRAKEYEQGVTASLKTLGDTRKLPKVMQVKQFGRANRSKYQGLAKEDTSRKDASTFVPLVHYKQSNQSHKTDIPTHKRKKKSG